MSRGAAGGVGGAGMGMASPTSCVRPGRGFLGSSLSTDGE